MSDHMFETATRLKLRFESPKGNLTVEQLWDMPLLGKEGFDLDTVAKGANGVLKALTEQSFVNTGRTPAHERAELAFEIVLHVIKVKQAEAEATKTRAAKRAERDQLLAILAEKQAGALSELSVQELQRRILATET